MKTKNLLVATFAFATLLAAFAPVACQNTDNSGDTSPGGSGGAATGPTGAGGAAGQTSAGGAGVGGGGGGVACGFTIAPGKGAQGFQDPTMASDTTAAAPNIRRVRLGLGGNVAVGAANRANPATSFGVGWQTDDGTLATKLAWGSSPDPSTWDPASVAQGYTFITPAGSLNAGEGPARMHEAYACGLTPGTTYYYRVGGGPTGGEVWSPVYSYVTAPATSDVSVKLAITGDSRGEQMNAWQILQERMHKRGDVTLQLFSGDMTNLAPDEGEWNQWLDRAAVDTQGMPSALPNLLTISAHGNHDNHGTLFFANMVLPQDPTYAQYGELFFSFDVGPVHLVVIDDFFLAGGSNPDYNSTLGAWLDADLAAAKANRGAVPWIVTMHHHPVFSSSLHGMDVDVGRVGAFLAPYYDKYHVDLDVAGHDHDYERSKPLNGTRDAPIVQSDPSMGTTYLVCAGSGADPYASNTSTFTDKSHDFQAGGAIGNYAIVTVDKGSLTIEGHNLTADGSDGVFDTFSIHK